MKSIEMALPLDLMSCPRDGAATTIPETTMLVKAGRLNFAQTPLGRGGISPFASFILLDNHTAFAAVVHKCQRKRPYGHHICTGGCNTLRIAVYVVMAYGQSGREDNGSPSLNYLTLGGAEGVR